MSIELFMFGAVIAGIAVALSRIIWRILQLWCIPIYVPEGKQLGVWRDERLARIGEPGRFAWVLQGRETAHLIDTQLHRWSSGTLRITDGLVEFHCQIEFWYRRDLRMVERVNGNPLSIPRNEADTLGLIAAGVRDIVATVLRQVLAKTVVVGATPQSLLSLNHVAYQATVDALQSTLSTKLGAFGVVFCAEHPLLVNLELAEQSVQRIMQDMDLQKLKEQFPGRAGVGVYVTSKGTKRTQTVVAGADVQVAQPGVRRQPYYNGYYDPSAAEAMARNGAATAGHRRNGVDRYPEDD